MGLDYEGLDLNELKQEHRRVSEEPGNSSSSDYLEKFVRLPERDGYTLLRILPRRKGQQFYCITRVHTLNNPRNNNKRTYHCPRTLSKNANGKEQWQGDCIICKYYNDLWQKSDQMPSGKAQEDLRNQARAIKPVERYYYNVIVRSEKDKDGNQRKNVGPKIYSCGKTVHSKILRAILGDPEAGEKELGDVTHPKDGRDFRVVKKVVKGGGGAEYPNYDNSKFEDPSPAGSPDEIRNWIETMYDLQSLRVLKTPEELKHALRVHLGMVKDEDEGGTDDLAEFRNAGAAPAKSAPAQAPEKIRENLVASTKPEPAKSSDDGVYADDDFMKELEGI